MHCHGLHCSAHDGTGSETTKEQKLQQVSASGPVSQECYVEYDTPYDCPTSWEGYQIPPRAEIDEIEEIIILQKLLRAIRGESEFGLVGLELKQLIQCNHLQRGATATPTSSFENRADHNPLITKIKTAEEGMEMETTHVCMKTYCVQTMTG